MKKILILEKGNHVSKMIAKKLLNEEYELISTSSRLGLNRTIPTLIPDLVIADLTTIKNDNVELLVQLKNNPVISLFPFLLITSQNKISREDLSSGLNFYIRKPYTEEEFLQLLKRILQESKRLSPW